jgi:hypothetical protein
MGIASEFYSQGRVEIGFSEGMKQERQQNPGNFRLLEDAWHVRLLVWMFVWSKGEDMGSPRLVFLDMRV